VLRALVERGVASRAPEVALELPEQVARQGALALVAAAQQEVLLWVPALRAVVQVAEENLFARTLFVPLESFSLILQCAPLCRLMMIC
jgi:hypothetical protein